MNLNKKISLSQEFILTLILAIGYAILSVILWYYNLGKYFVFGNIFGLVLIIYQIYLLIKPIHKKSLYSNLKCYIKKFSKDLRNDFENVNDKIITLLGKALAEKKERKRLIHHLPIRNYVSYHLPYKRNKKRLYLFYFILGLLFFNFSLYYGLSLSKDVFVYGFLGFVFATLIIILILYFVYRMIKRLIKWITK